MSDSCGFSGRRGDALFSDPAVCVLTPFGTQVVSQTSTADLRPRPLFPGAFLPEHLLAALCPFQDFLFLLVAMSTFMFQTLPL